MVYFFCILNNYKYEKFIELFDKINKENQDILFEILLSYKPYFKNEIKKDINFFNIFIKYATTKSYEIFFLNGLCYLKEINQILNVIENNLKEISSIKDFLPILIEDLGNKENLNKVNFKVFCL